MKVSVDVYTKDVDAGLAAFKKAIEVGASEVNLRSCYDWDTDEFSHLNLMFDADHTSEAISALDSNVFTEDSNNL